MRSTDAVTTAPAYDEFGLFHENAEEFGIALDAPPTVRRVAVDDRRRLRAQRAARGARTTPELVLLHGGAQNAHTWDTVALALDRPLVAIDLPGHGHSAHRDDHVYWPADNAVAIETGGARARARRRARRRHVARRAHRARARRPRARSRAQLVLVDVTPGVNREKSSAIAQFIDGPEYFESFDEILERTVAFNPTRTESSLRRGILHNAIEAPDGRWRWRYDLPRRGSGEGDDGQIMPGPRRSVGRGRRACGCRSRFVRGSLSPVVDDDDVAELLRRNPTRGRRGGRRRRSQRPGRQAAGARARSSPSRL